MGKDTNKKIPANLAGWVCSADWQAGISLVTIVTVQVP